MKTIDLEKLNACEDGLAFAQSKSSLIEAWNTCERGDWMLWSAAKLNCPLQLLTLAKAKCAETVIHLMHDERSIKAVKVAIDFGNGVASREELDAAADDADAAAYADDDYAASYAAAYDSYYDADIAANAYTAISADAAADAAAYAAADDDYAISADATADASAYASAYAAYAAYAAAEKENQLQTANICREILTDFIKSKIM